MIDVTIADWEVHSPSKYLCGFYWIFSRSRGYIINCDTKENAICLSNKLNEDAKAHSEKRKFMRLNFSNVERR